MLEEIILSKQLDTFQKENLIAIEKLDLAFLSSPIACVACERTELLKTEIVVIQMVLIFLLSIRIIFGTYGMYTYVYLCIPMVCIPMVFKLADRMRSIRTTGASKNRDSCRVFFRI